MYFIFFSSFQLYFIFIFKNRYLSILAIIRLFAYIILYFIFHFDIQMFISSFFIFYFFIFSLFSIFLFLSFFILFFFCHTHTHTHILSHTNTFAYIVCSYLIFFIIRILLHLPEKYYFRLF